MAVEDAYWKDLHFETLELISNLSLQRRNMPLIILTHIPFYKPIGSCPGDDPYVRMSERGMIQVQNLWLENTTEKILNDLQPILIFNGHDHSGCIYRHNNTQKSLEITVRSVMGDWGGHIGYLEISKNKSKIVANENGDGNELNLNGNGDFEYRYFSTNFVVIYFITFLSITSLIVLVLDFIFILTLIFFHFRNGKNHEKSD